MYMLTRRLVYEAHGFTCNPSYHSFDKEISEHESIELAAILERLKQNNEAFLNELFSLPVNRKQKTKEQW